MKLKFLPVAALLITAALTAFSAPNTTVPQLARVRTWGELLAQKPVPLHVEAMEPAASQEKPGPLFHLGIDRTRCGAYSGVVLYCLKEGTEQGIFQGRDLGPFVVTVRSPGLNAIAEIEILDGLIEPMEQTHYFFMTTVPFAKPGDYVIELRRPNMRGKPSEIAASATVHVTAMAEPRWSPWTEPKTATTKDIGLPNDGSATYGSMTVANPSNSIAIPAWDGFQPEEIRGNLPVPGTVLPKLFPGKSDPGVTLKLDGNNLVVMLDKEISAYFPDEVFLTRWWVNGRAFTPKPDAPPLKAMRNIGAKDVQVKEVRFRLEFDPAILGAKKGDTIGVQLLFCEKGWKFASEEQAALAQRQAPARADALSADGPPPIRISRMSNRVDFVYSGKPEAFQSMAQVKTWGALLATNPLSVPVPGGGFAAFHIGIDRTQCKPGGSVVFYCVESGTANMAYPVEDLGPFLLEITTPSTRSGGARKASSFPARRDGPLFYMQTIPMSETGETTLELHAGDRNDVAASVTVRVSGKPDATWLPWRSSNRENEPEPKATNEDASISMDVANPRKGPAMPEWDGGEAIVLDKIPDAKTPLPALLPASPAPGLRLSIRGRDLVVTMFPKREFFELDERFLTRWWVNGKPFTPKSDAPEVEARAWEGSSSLLGEVRFRMEFHPEALGAKKGDRIGVQLLFCEYGWEFVSQQMAAKALLAADDRPVPAENIRISRPANRVEFIYSGNPKNFVQKK